MKSKIQGRNYVILKEDYDRLPIKINKAKTNASLKNIEEGLSVIKETMRELYDADNEAYHFIRDTVFGGSDIDFEDGRSYKLNDALENVRNLKKNLKTNNDEIPKPEDNAVLMNLGYHFTDFDGHTNLWIWQKVLEDTEIRDRVEEILYSDTMEPIRRIRVTFWEKTEYGRSSTYIQYIKLKIGKKLAKAIENTKKKCLATGQANNKTKSKRHRKRCLFLMLVFCKI